MAAAIALPWVEPLEAAAGLTGDFVLLYSAAQASYSGRYSYLATTPLESFTSHSWDGLSLRLSACESSYPSWFGYLGYGLKDSLEVLPADQPSPISLPDLHMARFARIYRFDHSDRSLTLWSADGKAYPLKPSALPTQAAAPVISLSSNMSRSTYLENVRLILEAIHRGDLYQANLTRKFIGQWQTPPSAFSLFTRLCDTSPAPYSAYLQLGDAHIISSSPELFLRVDAHGQAEVRPIKGTAARGQTPAQDEQAANALRKSEKDRAENLMIVDLMRNDLSRTARLGSVKVASLFDITSHATIHHMSSTIRAERAQEKTTLDIVRGCFPPGSMTGAPKIRAMALCSELEKHARGVYSGAIGWFAGNGACELSVVIRTLVMQGNRFEFQVGGGIVADSTPEKELQETFDKSLGLLAALGISARDIEAL